MSKQVQLRVFTSGEFFTVRQVFASLGHAFIHVNRYAASQVLVIPKGETFEGDSYPVVIPWREITLIDVLPFKADE